MAIDTVEKRRCVAGNSPTPKGDITSYFDRRHIAYNYRGMPMPLAVGGNITPAGALTHLLTAYRSLSGNITPDGTLSRILTAYRTLNGALIPTGSIGVAPIFVVTLAGELTAYGNLSGRNPSWLLIDEGMRWMGEWDATTTYDANDTVLYKAASDTEWHIFTSKASHNTNNNPDSSAPWWRRVYQEQLR